jgi:hypothetical protein
MVRVSSTSNPAAPRQTPRRPGGRKLRAIEHAGQRRRDLPQALVAARMAIEIVELLEQVDIQNQQADFRAAFVGACHRGMRLALEVATIRNAGQGIDIEVRLGARQLLRGLPKLHGQRLLARLIAADIAHEHELADWLAIHPADGLHHQFVLRPGESRDSYRRLRPWPAKTASPATWQAPLALRQFRQHARRCGLNSTMVPSRPRITQPSRMVSNAQPRVVPDIVQMRSQRTEPDQHRHDRERGRCEITAERAGQRSR